MKTILMIFIVCVTLVTGTLGEDKPWKLSPEQTQTTTLGWTRSAIEGFALPTSVKPEETIKFFISVCDSGSQHQDYKIKIFRIPDITNPLYTSPIYAGTFYPLHDSRDSVINIGDYSRKAVDFKKGCKRYWEPTAISFPIPSNWKSGLYYAQLEHQSSVKQKNYYVPFIVRASVAGSTSNILFKFDINTFYAYDCWGGGSLYSAPQDPLLTSLTISDTIAIDRPMQFGVNYNYYANEFIRTLEDSSMAMEYCNNIDIDSLNLDGAVEIGFNLLNKYKTLVIWNHDEYWTQRERDYTESFIGKNDSKLHNNIARFAANTCYWKIKWLNNAHLQLSCDKWRKGKPNSYTIQSKFRDLDSTKPEGKFLGSQYKNNWNMISADSATEEPSDSVVAPEHWIFRGTGLKDGDTLGYGRYNLSEGRWHGLAAIELDNTIQTNGKADYPTTILAKRYVKSHGDGGHPELVLHQMIYYEDTTTNARVYGLGACGMSSALSRDAFDTKDKNRLKQMTVNIMSHFSEKKYIGNIYAEYLYPLVWKANIRLDGYVRTLAGKRLRIQSSPTITVDSVLFIDGELEIASNAKVIISGSGSLNINASGKLRLGANSTLTVNPATFIMEPGAQIIYESGAKLVINKAVIKNGATLNVGSNGLLDIISGSEVNFGQGSSLYSYGKVTAVNALFVSAGVTSTKNWGSIIFDGSGASSSVLNNVVVKNAANIQALNNANVTIQNSTIQDCTLGIYVYNASPQILNNQISNPLLHGIYVDALNKNPLILNNTITKISSNPNYKHQEGILLYNVTNGYIAQNDISGFYHGIYIGNSNAYFTNYNWQNFFPNNRFTSNRYGIKVGWGSYLNAGSGMNYCWNNSIYNNDYYNIYIYQSSTVQAQNNYWDVGNPKQSVDGSSHLYVRPSLSSDPWGYQNEAKSLAPTDTVIVEAQLIATSAKSVPAKSGLSKSEELFSQIQTAALNNNLSASKGEDEFMKGIILEQEGKIEEAIDYLKKLVKNKKFSQYALTELAGTKERYGKENLQTYFEDLLKDPNEGNKSRIKKHLAGFYLNKDEDDRAIAFFDELKDDKNSKKDNFEGLYEKFNYMFHKKKDIVLAKNLLEEMKDKFADDEETMIHITTAEMLISNNNNFALCNKQNETANSNDTEIPKEYALFNNYPNPFNPVTTINYQLPKDGLVILRIFDILGNEVKTLVNEQKEMGKYTVQFNASSLASGMYVYQLRVNDYTAVKKMMLVK